ncbi:BrnT family toxin [Nostoc sp.]|uniref:BrnT family toxin n=1 Tax=Nostoc sp. TaxID=1180 RepID=UPI002FFC6EA9
MDIVYQLQGVVFEWDSNKAQSNLEKHGITFEEATEVFFDPFYQFGEATPIKTSNNEQRFFIIGYSLEQRLLLVVYIERSLRTRIISARLASHTERKLYEQA